MKKKRKSLKLKKKFKFKKPLQTILILTFLKIVINFIYSIKNIFLYFK